MKAFIKVVVSLCLFALVFGMADATLRLKHEDGAKMMQDYYKLPENTVDVVLFGSSHMYIAHNPLWAWQDYGVPAYNLCSSMQPILGCYYYVVEALKTQSPKVLVVDVFMACFDMSYSTNAAMKTTSGMRFSQNKVDAVNALVHEDERMDVLLGFPLYHTRYKDINKEDFAWLPGLGGVSPHGFVPKTAAQPLEPEVAGTGVVEGLNPERKAELVVLIEYAREQGVPLVLMAAPYQTDEGRRAQHAEIAALADEYGCPFLDYNMIYPDAGIDFATDFFDPTHMNVMGTKKLTAHLMAWLVAEYALPDRRQDAAYGYYENWAREYGAVFEEVWQEALLPAADI